ncbi:hypothetical protein [Silvimonas sp.]|uniref:hypothetical protein n=1 Tax=Silvimonas sp. TaxID=2650811 RepID=UPI002850B011|nr:hypothetical protein [Silvimonas sp.]MDR3427966.1 hypothetical protein [Silvimonas sp.]
MDHFLHNAHVLTWMSFQHFLAARYGRQLAQLYWATQHKHELEHMATTGWPFEEFN